MEILSNEIWRTVHSRLMTGMNIRNWTVLKGYLGDTFLIKEITESRLVINSPNAKNLVNVPRGDFERFSEVWSVYKNGRMRRSETSEITRFSKYIISIFHWLEMES